MVLEYLFTVSFFTGSDTTSAFYCKGKVTALKIANTQIFLECHLYGFEECSDVNAVRYQAFKSGKYDEELLPPNQDSLDQHISRANYQCYIWRHAVQPVLNLPSFCEYGWEVDDVGNVLVKWMTIAPDQWLVISGL